jgi:hypothetical protein
MVTMLADLSILALIVAFECVATLGHILLGVALLTGRGGRRAPSNGMMEPATAATPSNAASELEPARRKLAA